MPKRKPISASQLFDSDQELVEFLTRLPRIGLGEGYGRVERARDFIEVFNTSDTGQRVLSQILDFCRPFDGERNADKPGLLAFNSGRRYVLGLITKAFDSQTREIVTEEKI